MIIKALGIKIKQQIRINPASKITFKAIKFNFIYSLTFLIFLKSKIATKHTPPIKPAKVKAKEKPIKNVPLVPAIKTLTRSASKPIKPPAYGPRISPDKKTNIKDGERIFKKGAGSKNSLEMIAATIQNASIIDVNESMRTVLNVKRLFKNLNWINKPKPSKTRIKRPKTIDKIKYDIS